jgi:tRNA pseudouridine32 synthase
LAGKISVNGKRVKLDYKIRNADIICHSMHRHEPPVTDENIRVVFRDDQVMVIDKPASIPVSALSSCPFIIYLKNNNLGSPIRKV